MFRVISDFYGIIILIILAILLVLSMVVPISEAETIELKNGTVLKGSIIEMDQTDLKLQTADMGLITLKRSTISSINDGVSIPAVSRPAITPPTTDITSQGGAENVNININNNQNNAQNQTQTASQPVVPNVPAPAMQTASKSDKSFYGHLSMGMMYPFIVVDDEFYNGFNREGEGYSAVTWEVLNYRGEDLSGGLIGQGTRFNTGDGLEGEILFGGVHFDALFAKHSLFGAGQGFLSLGGVVGLTRYKAKYHHKEQEYIISNPDYIPSGKVGLAYSPSGRIDKMKAQGNTYGARLSYNYISSGVFGLVVSANYLEGRLEAKIEDGVLGEKNRSVRFRSHSVTAGLLYNFSI